MKISLKYSLITIIQLSLLCCANAKGLKRRPAALSFTPKIKVAIKYKHTLGNPFFPHEANQKQKPTKKIIQQKNKHLLLEKTYLDPVKTALFCPNDYEFKAVYDALKHMQIELTPYPDYYTQHVYGTQDDTFNLTALKKQKLNPMYLFSFGGNFFCLALCGQRTSETSLFLPQFVSLFKNLKTVFLYGICGCTNTKLRQGTIMLSCDYFMPDNAVLGKKKGEMDITLIENVNFNCIKHINVDENIRQFNEDLYAYIQEKSSGLQVCPCQNFTSDFFLNHPSVNEQINSILESENVCINTEDFTIAKFFHTRQIPLSFYPIRTVSDHAETSKEGKKTACKSIFNVVPITLEFLTSK